MAAARQPVPWRARVLKAPRRRRDLQPAATVAERMMALFAADPGAVLRKCQLAARLGTIESHIDVPLTNLINAGHLVELAAGFMQAGSEAKARRAQEEAARAAPAAPQPRRGVPPEAIIRRAFALAQGDCPARAASFLDRAAQAARLPAPVAVNFRALGDLIIAAQGRYRDVPAAQLRAGR